jgi:hypothetical protein
MENAERPSAYVERNEPGHADSGGRVVAPFQTDDQMNEILGALSSISIGERIATALERIAAAIGAPQRGTCRICGCTHFEPCPEGCAWADATETLCDNPECLAKAGLGSSDVEESRHG